MLTYPLVVFPNVIALRVWLQYVWHVLISSFIRFKLTSPLKPNLHHLDRLPTRRGLHHGDIADALAHQGFGDRG